MIDILEFREKLRISPGPSQMGRSNPFTEIVPTTQADLVAIHGPSKLQAIESRGPREYIGHPGAVVVSIPCVARTAYDFPSAIAHANAISKSRPARGNVSLRQESYEMYRCEFASHLDHFRPVDCRLQPCTMVEGRIPVSDGSVIAAERKFEEIVVVVPN